MYGGVRPGGMKPFPGVLLRMSGHHLIIAR